MSGQLGAGSGHSAHCSTCLLGLSVQPGKPWPRVSLGISISPINRAEHDTHITTTRPHPPGHS